MSHIVKQISSLEKILATEELVANEITEKTLLKGQSFSYQIAINSKYNTDFKVKINSPIEEYLKLYLVKNIIADTPTLPNDDTDYISKEPCLIPDMLMPLDKENAIINNCSGNVCLWITAEIPENVQAGKYSVEIEVSTVNLPTVKKFYKTMNICVIDAVIGNNKTLFTQWFHVDCIADTHQVPIYSEEHWNLIDKYMALANELGINMILTPIITPPVDTAENSARPCTQLVKIENKDGTYHFNFDLLKRWINLAKKNNINYFEMAHLFTQWGLKSAPNIMVTKNGEESYEFGWHTSSKSDEYKNFLNAFLPQLVDFLENEGIKENCYFHISDEPNIQHLEMYEYAYNLVKPLLGGCKTMDAISDYDFFDKGLIEIPVTASSHIEPFLNNNSGTQWVYYCCVQHDKVGNRFLSMPSYRNRILGLQMYKYNIKGFLHWGYNFYYSQLSVEKIDPYVTTSSKNAFPSGDPFSVYPIYNDATPSLRAVIFKEALQDIEICRMLEKYIGREKVVAMIDNAAQMNITFDNYPRNNDYIPTLIEEMTAIIKEHI